MVRLIIGAVIVVTAAVTSLSAGEEQKLIDENRLSISFHSEKIAGATKTTKVVVIPDELLKDCDPKSGACTFAWGKESMLATDSTIVTSLELDLKAIDCQVAEASGQTFSAKCIQRVVPLTKSQFDLEQAGRKILSYSSTKQGE